MNLESCRVSGYKGLNDLPGSSVPKPSKDLLLDNLRNRMATTDSSGKKRFNNAALARACGVDPGTVTNWLKGKISPEVGRLTKIAEYLEIPVRDLFLDPTDSRTPSMTYVSAYELLGELVKTTKN